MVATTVALTVKVFIITAQFSLLAHSTLSNY
jgi:hypothetical protein